MKIVMGDQMATDLHDDELTNHQDAVKLYLSALLGGDEELTRKESISNQDSQSVDHKIRLKGNNQKTESRIIANNKDQNLPNESVPKENRMNELSTMSNKIENTTTAPASPSWASHRFANSMISVCGVKLLIPTQFIRGVRRLNRSLIPVTKETSWIKGRYQKNFEDIVTINTKLLVYGREEFIPTKYIEDNDVYLVIVGNGKWGFACESIGHGINLFSQDVAWRKKQGHRRWIAGTSVDNKAAIVDVRRVELSLIMDGILL